MWMKTHTYLTEMLELADNGNKTALLLNFIFSKIQESIEKILEKNLTFAVENYTVRVGK